METRPGTCQEPVRIGLLPKNQILNKKWRDIVWRKNTLDALNVNIAGSQDGLGIQGAVSPVSIRTAAISIIIL